jgi:hypothetical protein
VSWPPNSKRWRIGARGLSGLPQGSATCYVGYQQVGPNWPIIWMRPSNSLEWSWLHDRRRMQI